MGLALFAATLLYAALPADARTALDVPCLLTTVIGITCPGCGIKTAIVELLSGHWHRAIDANIYAPIVLAAIVGAAAKDAKNLIQKGGSVSV